jgi:hypothetical protein
MFATAPRHGFGLGEIHFFRRKTRAFMRTVAERLALGPAAGAPIKTAGLHRQDERGFLSDDWFHNERTLALPGKIATHPTKSRRGNTLSAGNPGQGHQETALRRQIVASN